MTTWIPQLTQDGSYTFLSAEFGETFHTTLGAKTEAFQKFVEATDLLEKAHRPIVRYWTFATAWVTTQR
jgi:hypothetical protein